MHHHRSDISSLLSIHTGNYRTSLSFISMDASSMVTSTYQYSNHTTVSKKDGCMVSSIDRTMMYLTWTGSHCCTLVANLEGAQQFHIPMTTPRSDSGRDGSPCPGMNSKAFHPATNTYRPISSPIQSTVVATRSWRGENQHRWGLSSRKYNMRYGVHL